LHKHLKSLKLILILSLKLAGLQKAKKAKKVIVHRWNTTYADFDGDGLKDAIVSDYGTMCYGTGVGYYIVAQQKTKLKQLFKIQASPIFFKRKELMAG
jgi:hypothetical protein